MDSETTQQGPPERPRDIPNIGGIEIKRVRLDPPVRFYRLGRLISEENAIELLVRTSAPMPILNVTPVLFIGDQIVDSYERVGPNLYRFLAFDPERLPRGARISIGWPYAPSAKIPTPFVFDPSAFPVA